MNSLWLSTGIVCMMMIRQFVEWVYSSTHSGSLRQHERRSVAHWERRRCQLHGQSECCFESPIHNIIVNRWNYWAQLAADRPFFDLVGRETIWRVYFWVLRFNSWFLIFLAQYKFIYRYLHFTFGLFQTMRFANFPVVSVVKVRD